MIYIAVKNTFIVVSSCLGVLCFFKNRVYCVYSQNGKHSNHMMGVDGVQVRFFSKEGWQENKFHFHDTLEILLTMSEGECFFVRNKMYPITRGSLYVLSPDDLHRSSPSCKTLYQFYSIRFYAEEVAAFSSDGFDILACFRNHEQFNHRVQLLGDQLDHLLKLINKMEYYLSVDCTSYGKEVFIKTLLAEILVYINYLYSVPSRPSPPDNEEVSKLQPVIAYIQEHISEELPLELLAQQIFVSKYYLSHRFKEIMGFTLSEYIIHRRLVQAKSLLRNGSSVAFAGERSGFNSSAHFIRTFIKYENISPKQYAKQYRVLENYWTPSPAHRDAFLIAPPEQEPPRQR